MVATLYINTRKKFGYASSLEPVTTPTALDSPVQNQASDQTAPMSPSHSGTEANSAASPENVFDTLKKLKQDNWKLLQDKMLGMI
jgi:hypothetical protein